MIRTPAATSVQLARAKAIGKALTHAGWTSRREPDGTHPGAVEATTYRHGGVMVLILSLGGRNGQIIEITADTLPKATAVGGRHSIPGRPSWRLTAYDAPVQAIVAAAQAAREPGADPAPLQVSGWSVEHAPARRRNAPSTVRATRFTRHDETVIATFHAPTFNPPCEHCTHCGDLGDTGGWSVAGPGFIAEATAHVPSTLIGAFLRALPGGAPDQAAATQGRPKPRRKRNAKSTSAAVNVHAARLTAAVR